MTADDVPIARSWVVIDRPYSKALKIEPQFQLELALRRDPVPSRRSLEGHLSERVRVVEIHDRAAIIWRCGEARRRRTRYRMIENVSRIHPDLAREGLTDFEPFGYGHIRIPDSCRLDAIQTDIAACAGLRVLKDDILRRLLRDGVQAAERPQAGINRKALWIRNLAENIAKVESIIRALVPPDPASSFEIERPYLVGCSTAIEHALAIDR